MEAHELTDEEQRQRGIIERTCERWGFSIDGWERGEEGAQATLGRWRPIEDDEDEGLYADDEGLLTASVVGGVEYGNERVCFWFTPDGMDSGMEVRSPDMLESAD